jgi:cation diffusion facilitator CzcD-associated flavoprotein CzcO
MSQAGNSAGKLRFAVIGAGMAGLLAAIKLKQRGEKFTYTKRAIG